MYEYATVLFPILGCVLILSTVVCAWNLRSNTAIGDILNLLTILFIAIAGVILTQYNFKS